MFASMGGEAGEARQLAGLLRGGGGDLAAQRVARLVAEACAGVEPAEASRQCAALRDSLLQLCSDGTLTLPEARLLCRKIDGAQAAMLEALSSPQRALDALERALSDTPVRGLPELAVQGALSADSAALLIGENGQLVVRATAGLELPHALRCSSQQWRAGLRQKAAKSCEPRKGSHASCMARRSSGASTCQAVPDRKGSATASFNTV